HPLILLFFAASCGEMPSLDYRAFCIAILIPAIYSIAKCGGLLVGYPNIFGKLRVYLWIK
ncbi:MAG TPA: hypothetical protein PL171_05785, partial [Anaerolineaceae bacterium]|nr:hypothetical protein [Anaerolineaceae bacterium]